MSEKNNPAEIISAEINGEGEPFTEAQLQYIMTNPETRKIFEKMQESL